MNKILISGIIFLAFATTAKAEYIGRLNANPFDPESCANEFSECGNPFSPTSPRNPFGPYGNPFSPYSVNSIYGPGARLYGDDAPDSE